MKKVIFLFLLFLGLGTLNSCRKDTSNSPSTDLCRGVSCLNGGYCANGQCVCPEGYTGANCSQQRTPTLMRIYKIEVTQFPLTDAGAGWDLTSGPDIFPTLYLGNTVIWSSTNFFQNASSGTVYSFIPSPALELTSPTSQYTIGLYDYDDFDADDYMGGINFIPYYSTNGFPSVLSVNAGAGVAFKIYVGYSW